MPRQSAEPAGRLVLMQGALIREADAMISVFDRGVMYGESVFETIKVVDGEPCLWEAHLERLAVGCRSLGFPIDIRDLTEDVRRLLEAEHVDLGGLRIQVTGGVQPGGGRGLVVSPEARKPTVVARLDEVHAPPAELYRSGVAVVTATDLCRPVPAVKSGSYLASVAGKTRAASAGAFECLLATDGPERGDAPELLEGSFTSILSHRDGVFVRPPAGRTLAGVTQRTIVEGILRGGGTVVEETLSYGAALEDGLILTSSLLGACPVSRLDGQDLPVLTEVTASVRALLEEAEESSRSRWRKAVK